MDKNETPSRYNATDDNELFCFISVEENTQVISNGISSSKKTTFEASSRASLSQRVSVPAVIQRPVPSPAPKPLTDSEYASREMSTGKYREPLTEVYNHPSLKKVFLKNLKELDSRLYGVLAWWLYEL